MVMQAQGSFFLFLIISSSFLSTNTILHACAFNQAQHNPNGLSSPPSNRISIYCQPHRMAITKCNHNRLLFAFVKHHQDPRGTDIRGIIGTDQSIVFYGKGGLPEPEDWKSATAFCVFLKKFADATNKLSAWKSVTANILFVELISLQTEINRACSSSDLILRRVGGCMKEKFDKYWGSVDQMNKIIMIANVLDPRYKLEYFVTALQIVNASPEVIDTIERDLTDLLNSMYQTYKGQYEASTVQNTAGQMMDTEEMTGLDEVSRMIARRREASQSVVIRNEVDQYLNDRCVAIEIVNFDVANWWKVNEGQYPVLSKLAKDILAIPCSTMASENAFSLGSRVVDPFRASLTPAMVEALVCTKDWLTADPFNLYQEPTEDELEFYKELEDMEKEIAGKKTQEEQHGVADSARTI